MQMVKVLCGQHNCVKIVERFLLVQNFYMREFNIFSRINIVLVIVKLDADCLSNVKIHWYDST